MRITTSFAAALTGLVLATTLTACGGGGDDSPTATETTSSPATSPSDADQPGPSEPSATKTSEGPRLEVTVNGDQVSPNAEEISLGTGEPLTLQIRSDRAGELHVHAKPEQYVEFGAGTTTTELVIDTPGSVEVEEHESGAVVAQIEVR